LTAFPYIRTRDLSIYFGAIAAVRGVDLDIELGERVGLVGPNGCGKTTLLNAIFGSVPMACGSLTIAGKDVSRVRPCELVAGIGIAPLGRGFQSPFLIGELSLAENCVLAAWGHARYSGWRSMAPGRSALSPKSPFRVAAERALDVVGIDADTRRQKPDSLPFGLRKLAEVARILAARPRFLLLDEPTSGLATEEASTFCEALARLEDPSGLGTPLGFLVVDHDMGTIEKLCSRVLLMDEGRIVADGPTGAVINSPMFDKVYLDIREPKVTAPR
jgi:ABC-type branched-subunit amino acid transport system ATPase component